MHLTPPQRPDLEIIDSHCHLFLPEFSDLPEIMTRAANAGVIGVINVGLDVASSKEAIRLAELYPQFRATVGWHPHDSGKMTAKDELELLKLAENPLVVGFGEIGLDFFRLHTPRPTQLKAFETLLDLASQTGKPVIIHTREALAETKNLLTQYRTRLSKILIHCFTGTLEEALAWIDLDCYLSLPGVLTYPKAAHLKEVAAKIPRDRILLETDAPYLAPIPHRSHRNEPAYLIHHVKTLAEALILTEQETAALATANTRIFFQLTGI